MARRMASVGVGAQAGRWGVLSGDATWHVEVALERLADRLETLHHTTGEEAAKVLAGDVRAGVKLMPGARARVHLGDEALRAVVAERLGELAARVSPLDSLVDGYGPLDDPNGGLEFFLPVSHRERPADLWRIVRRNRPVRVAVGHDREQLRLDQIEVWPSLRRMGAGNAPLTDLCLFADACGKAITGAGAAGWLGAWYRRHGFVPARGDEWKLGTEMIRPPQAR
ncbi:MAG: hypothetical protein ACRDIZ_15240 [Actinomycetota bacterium]